MHDTYIQHTYENFTYGQPPLRLACEANVTCMCGAQGVARKYQSIFGLFYFLGVADDGDTVEQALESVRGAIQVYIESLVEDKIPVPVDQPEEDMVTTTQVVAPPSLRFV